MCISRAAITIKLKIRKYKEIILSPKTAILEYIF